jgi:hypothetical protein
LRERDLALDDLDPGEMRRRRREMIFGQSVMSVSLALRPVRIPALRWRSEIATVHFVRGLL